MAATWRRAFDWMKAYCEQHTPRDPFPTYKELQRCIGASEDTISKAIKELENQGWIVRKRAPEKG